jgi:hypothetical protein
VEASILDEDLGMKDVFVALKDLIRRRLAEAEELDSRLHQA